MANNKDQTSLKLIGMATNMFSANKDEIEAFLGAWDDYLYIFEETISERGRVLKKLIDDLKEYAEERYQIRSV
ncbi:MAG: hypothetical protein ACOCRU_02875 [bacterium]